MKAGFRLSLTQGLHSLLLELIVTKAKVSLCFPSRSSFCHFGFQSYPLLGWKKIMSLIPL